MFYLAIALLVASFSAVSGVTCPAYYDADVLILGAGMSGISAARSLYENGVDNFLILEARDRIGGRMRSEEFGGIRVELGEQWIYGFHMHQDPPKRLTAHNHMQKLAKRCGLKGFLPQFNESKAFHNKDKLITNKTLNEVSYNFGNATVDALIGSYLMKEKGLPDISVEQALMENGWIAETPLQKLVEWDFFNFLMHESTDTASLYRTFPTKIFDDFGADYLLVTDQRGSEHLLYCMAEDFRLTPDDPRLKLQTKVLRVHNGDSCVCVDTILSYGERKRYCAKYAIMTFSLGVLQSRNVKFIPRLPQWKKQVINFFPMGQVLRIFCKFNYSFWEDVTFIDRADNFKGRFAAFQPLDNFRYNISSSPVNVIEWSFIDKAADAISSQPIWVTKKETLEVLHELYPKAVIPEPEEFLVTDWKHDPLYFGAIVTKPVGATDAMYDALSAPVGRLYFSGDAVHKDYSGLLHSSYYSGIEVGKNIANELKTKYY